jgi:hypothetical protein
MAILRIFLFLYTVFMLAISIFSLVMVPRSLRQLGHERQLLRQDLPEASFERLVEIGYRLNSLLVLAEVFYYFLLIRYWSSEPGLRYGAFSFGLIHIAYLVTGRLERRRLAQGSTHTHGARLLIWSSAAVTVLEIVFLWVVIYYLVSGGNGG